MKQNTAQELIYRQCHELFSIAMRAISPSKSNLTVGEGDQAVVGNGDTMSIAAEISKHIFRAAEGPFTVNNPFVTE